MSKNLWITGAGKGIGRATALEYARCGWSVAVSARTETDLESLIESAIQKGFSGRIVSYPADVTDQDAMKRTFKAVEQDIGALDQVILNAGTHMPSSAKKISTDSYRALLEINVMGAVNGLSAVIPVFIDRKRGHVGVVASVAGYSGLPLAGAYGASKAALINMCESLRPELEAEGVGLSVINPGFVRTPLTAKNKFPMPFLIDADVAARQIYSGMIKGKFEIAFPRSFVIILKILRMLPYGIYFPLIKKVTGV
ncbi:MAG TPA: oxidoreductase [Rhodospirillaceae bacterium]|nr:oxidoreductase [Candidatus Neomarinimicrobiota bacterium]HCX14953.1 oxidoreductase [Rhodospirillaceae bacterium]